MSRLTNAGESVRRNRGMGLAFSLMTPPRGRTACRKLSRLFSESLRTRSTRRRSAIPTLWLRTSWPLCPKTGCRIVPEDTALGDQPFDELTHDKRPQDTYGDGRDCTFNTGEHGGDEPDNMPQVIEATDAAGRWAIYVPLTRGGKVVVPRPRSGGVSAT